MKKSPCDIIGGMRTTMNKKEELKKAVIECCVSGTMTVKDAANRLKFSERYIKKLKARYKKIGASSMMHGNCGRQPKHTIDASIKSKIWDIWNLPELEECNFTHFQEILQEEYKINISYTALHNFLKSKGAKSPRKHKKVKAYNRRKERPSSGELLQVDATPYQFFYGDTKNYCLHGFIDDATHKVTGLCLCENECMHGYLEVTRQTLKNWGIPLALYADGSSIFFATNNKITIDEQLAGITKPSTQYGKMMEFLGVNLIHAKSSQAKGRVERLWNTLHDRLRTEFRIHNITTIEEANAFLKMYIPKFNKKFSVEPQNPKSSFMKLPKNINLDYLLSVKYTRTADVSNCISINGTTFVIDTKEILHKKKIEICISKRIGMKAHYNDKWYKITPIAHSNKNGQKSSDSVDAIIQQFIQYNCLKSERLSA